MSTLTKKSLSTSKWSSLMSFLKNVQLLGQSNRFYVTDTKNISSLGLNPHIIYALSRPKNDFANKFGDRRLVLDFSNFYTLSKKKETKCLIIKKMTWYQSSRRQPLIPNRHDLIAMDFQCWFCLSHAKVDSSLRIEYSIAQPSRY